ncbi:MAG: hypothetical protein IKV68_02460, partial [Oscillospiraceae bacterium]|nr:hypothetical protein [Oscillospiraceae bacterium]
VLAAVSAAAEYSAHHCQRENKGYEFFHFLLLLCRPFDGKTEINVVHYSIVARNVPHFTAYCKGILYFYPLLDAQQAACRKQTACFA